MNNQQIQASNILTTEGGIYQAVAGFLRGVVSEAYEVKLIKNPYVITRPCWKAKDVLNNISFLDNYNKSGLNIYIRPLDKRFILLDDLERCVLDSLAEIKPCLLMETSQGNYQAWLKLQEVPAERSELLQIWRRLAARFNADMASAKPEQIGRLPGFYNRKEKYFPNFPLVKLHRSLDRFSTWEPSNPENPENPENYPPPVVKMKTDVHKKPGKDRSAFDFALACSLIEQGKTDDEIRSYISTRSDKAKTRNDNYLDRTIQNARKHKRIL
jgi:hypothetical protein